MIKPTAPFRQVQHRPDGQSDAERIVRVSVELSDDELADAFCARRAKNQVAILEHVAEHFRRYPMRREDLRPIVEKLISEWWDRSKVG